MKATLTILGCGNSSGVPAAGGYWGQCNPDEPKNLRTRSSIAIQSETTTLIVDTGPDFRNQTIRENIQNLDAVLYSHHHSDHVNGIDDLRGFAFRSKNQVPVYGSQETLDILGQYFPYAFKGGNHELYPPILKPNMFETFGEPHTIGDIEFIPFQMDHGSCTATGYRFGDVAYSVDMLTLDETAIQTLRGINTWIVDAAAYKNTDNSVHANFETITELNQHIGARQIYLSSLSLIMDYQTLKAEIPENWQPAHDGLKIEITL